METIRLTMAQALTRYLAAQRTRDRRRRRAALRRRVGDLRARQRRRHGRGAACTRARRCRPSARTTSRRWRMRRSPSPRRRAGADDGLHHLDRARRHQHGDGRRGRACQPPAGAAAARRHLRQPAARSGAAAGRGFRRRHGLGERLLPAGVALFRPHHAARSRSCPRCQRAMAGADRSGGMRPGHAWRCARTCRPRPTTIPEASSKSGSGRRAGSGPTRRARARPWRSSSAREEAVHRGGRRRALFRGREGARGLRGARGIPVAETQAGKSSLAVDHPQAHRARSASPARGAANALARGGRRRARDRHAPAGFHHRLPGAVQEPGAASIIGLNAQAFDAGKHGAHPAGGRRARRARAPRRGARRLAAPAAWTRRAADEQGALDASIAARYTGATQRGAAVRRAGDRRGAARGQAQRHRGLRRRRPAGRTAQALAGRRAGRLPPRIRLFLHGLRDRRRHRRQDGRARRARSSSWSATAPT